MSTINYDIVGYDSDTNEYIVTYSVAGVSKRILVSPVTDGSSIDSAKTKVAIGSQIQTAEAPPPSIPEGTDSLLGDSGTVQVTAGSV
jgi:hypothetical protein